MSEKKVKKEEIATPALQARNDGGKVHNDIVKLEEALEHSHKEVRDAKEALLYLKAEFENYKRRREKEKENFLKYNNESLLRSLLTVVDHLERACEHKDSESAHNILLGVKMTLQEFKNVLNKYGVSEIESVGKLFDPHFHEALGHEKTEKEKENHIMSELQKGYMYKDRLLRPARVIIAKEKKKDSK
ncbi:MAG: nucleotide exchange factor GrpE [Deltaproteobacteria bacterium]|nr:nucleotide exchange factor GrpE [Deltaproteobacteria bacterium]